MNDSHTLFCELFDKQTCEAMAIIRVYILFVYVNVFGIMNSKNDTGKWLNALVYIMSAEV